MHKNIASNAGRNQLSVAIIAIVFILVSALLAFLVAGSIQTITITSDEIDDSRAMHAADGALQSLRKQLGATVRDNAYWDDAYREVSLQETKTDWIIENWASTTADYPLYDTAIVVDASNKVVVAYRDGEDMGGDWSEFFGGAFNEMLSAARKASKTDPVPVYFVRSAAGVALIGAATIQPSLIDNTVDPRAFHVLVFAKHLTPTAVAEVSEAFSIDHLTLVDARPNAGLSVPLYDVTGREIAFFSWPSEKPGTESYLKVKPTLRAAAFILVLFLCAIGAVGLVTVSRLRASESRARFRADHDPLTGLLNRSGLIDRMSRVSAVTQAEHSLLRLHFIDLDGFKGVNDAWGHGVGDELIAAVSRRLLDTLPTEAHVARLGGDEFAVVTVDRAAAQTFPAIGQQIQIALEREFEIGGRTIAIGASVGVAINDVIGADVGELIRRADIALYRAKDRGRGITIEFEEEFDRDTKVQAELEEHLRQTLSTGGIGVAYQPLVHASSGAICGVEALARWQRADGTRHGPDMFIPLAERSGLIDILGMQVLEKSLKAAKRWTDITLAINVSPLQLKNPKFVQNVLDALAVAEFDPQRLCIEVTEGVLISDPEQAQRAISGLKDAGIKISLDDYGSGFASIGTLRQFGFDRMKIDRSLILALGNDENGGAVLQATIALANALHIPVTAEGIETEAQAMAVRLCGCDELQGYLFSRPVTEDEITAFYFGEIPAAASGVM
ncbi:EAL domain-containing protein [Rhizobium herbae]|uniref:Diguanylate cyclase (GGDEF)-like protein n=1 Tax=Rhizobium herbae TaxID=508661 RepID=A0ABS4EW24_9HYPH|nr:EAL domain-containing protein [Rhizobium herbae]MBP1862113.1 diguanylate cyclase (GGDEF)-like protein [Rhizobium herbae]